ncbi:helix-turn-helix domain-containing protein [Mesorhizobium sp. M1329]|uniref:helix-turn-helix domain-containing protein n=1 Tax=Mesorhizobium sp. M1329 TaxID=2957083 RepID=UPI00333C1311
MSLTVAKTMSLLWLFNEEEPELSLRDLALRAGLHNSTTHRLLVSLAEEWLCRAEPRNPEIPARKGLVAACSNPGGSLPARGPCTANRRPSCA